MLSAKQGTTDTILFLCDAVLYRGLNPGPPAVLIMLQLITCTFTYECGMSECCYVAVLVNSRRQQELLQETNFTRGIGTCLVMTHRNSFICLFCLFRRHIHSNNQATTIHLCLLTIGALS